MTKAKNDKKIYGRLKNLFVSHEGNNYHPHILKHKRLLFHSVSAIALKALLLIGVVLIPVSAYLTPDVSSEQSKKIIVLTNEVRKNAGIKLLTENKLLDEAALAKAQDMLVAQYFAHISPQGLGLDYFLKQINYKYATAGENLAMGFSGADDVVNAWTRSKTHYANIIDPDFSEIGVGMVSGDYKNFNTTFVAQFFGATSKVAVKTSSPTQNNGRKETSKQNANNKVLGEKVVAAKPLEVDLSKTQVWVDEPEGKTQKIVRAVVYTSDNVTKAEVNFGSYFINLVPDESTPGLWSGSLIIFQQAEEQIFNPVVLPTLTISDASGAVETFDLKWQNIKPVKSSLLDQYFFAKQIHNNNYLGWLFSISMAYYKILLALVIFALLLNILVNFEKRQYKVIVPSLAFIALLTILILF
ncbi:MAG: CAP domain-containing protein [Patescibacteria group bacterium]|nr:CAP domain-containing protein [Patescibacteria group bacterium]